MLRLGLLEERRESRDLHELAHGRLHAAEDQAFPAVRAMRVGQSLDSQMARKALRKGTASTTDSSFGIVKTPVPSRIAIGKAPVCSV